MQYQSGDEWKWDEPSPSRMWAEAEGWGVDPKTDTITNPGRYEGEECWVPYYAEMAGMGEEEELVAVNGVMHWCFLINGHEKKVCPLLEGFMWVVVWKREDGHWYGEKLDRGEWEEVMEKIMVAEDLKGLGEDVGCSGCGDWPECPGWADEQGEEWKEGYDD